MWLIVFPGMISRILYPNDVACNEVATCTKNCGRKFGCYDIAYPLLVVRVGTHAPQSLTPYPLLVVRVGTHLYCVVLYCIAFIAFHCIAWFVESRREAGDF